MIIAHRGESYLAPENTMAAINLAWKNGAKAVEIDVRLTADDKIVVIHDATTNRTGNIKQLIKSSSLQELSPVDVGIKKGSQWKGESIPTLQKVLDTLPQDGKLILEIKCGVEMVSPLVDLIVESEIPFPQIEIISFNQKVLTEAKKLLPGVKMLWLLDLDYYLPHWILWINKKKLIRKVHESHLDGVNVWVGNAIDREFVDAFKSENLLVYTWTVDDPAMAHWLMEINVDAITTNRPQWLKQQLILLSK